MAEAHLHALQSIPRSETKKEITEQTMIASKPEIVVE